MLQVMATATLKEVVEEEEDEEVNYEEEGKPFQGKPHESSRVLAEGGGEALGLNATQSELFKMIQAQNSY